MKKSLNIFIVVIMIFMITNIFNMNKSYATQAKDFGVMGSGKQTTTINPDDYDPSDNPLTVDDAGIVLDKVGIIIGTIRNLSVIVSVIVLVIIGVKYILGSVEQKANYKASLLPYVIGCILAVGGTTLVDFIYQVVH